LTTAFWFKKWTQFWPPKRQAKNDPDRDPGKVASSSGLCGTTCSESCCSTTKQDADALPQRYGARTGLPRAHGFHASLASAAATPWRITLMDDDASIKHCSSNEWACPCNNATTTACSRPTHSLPDHTWRHIRKNESTDALANAGVSARLAGQAASSPDDGFGNWTSVLETSAPALCDHKKYKHRATPAEQEAAQTKRDDARVDDDDTGQQKKNVRFTHPLPRCANSVRNRGSSHAGHIGVPRQTDSFSAAVMTCLRRPRKFQIGELVVFSNIQRSILGYLQFTQCPRVTDASPGHDYQNHPFALTAIHSLDGDDFSHFRQPAQWT
jgi:hypothetical protein